MSHNTLQHAEIIPYQYGVQVVMLRRGSPRGTSYADPGGTPMVPLEPAT